MNDDQEIDIQKLLYKFLGCWKYFLFTIPCFLLVAFLVNRSASPIYKISTSLLIDKPGNIGSGLGGFMGKIGGVIDVGLENEREILKSKSFTEGVVKDLGFELEYYIGNREIYDDSFCEVHYDRDHGQVVDAFFQIEWLTENTFKIHVNFDDVHYTYNYKEEEFHLFKSEENLDKKFKMNEWIESANYRFKLVRKDFSDLGIIEGKNNQFRFRDYQSLVLQYNKATSFSMIGDAEVIEISMEGSSKVKMIAYLNKLTESYIYHSLKEKNRIVDKTVEFIEVQLSNVGDLLSVYEDELEVFRSQTGLMDIRHEAKEELGRFLDLDDLRANMNVQLEYYRDVLEYLEANEISSIIAPSVVGIEDPILLNLVRVLQDLKLEYSKLEYTLGKENSTLMQLQIQINQTRESLLANVKNLIDATQAEYTDLNLRIEEKEYYFSLLPKLEREMLTIQRKYNVQDKTFKTLLEKRIEVGVVMAGNQADHRVINPAKDYGLDPIGPNKNIYYLLAILLALIIPIACVLLKDFFNTTINTLGDLEQLTTIPVVGVLGINFDKFNLSASNKLKSNITESVRALRINLDSMISDTDKCSVIALTSLVFGEGKEFLSKNLACSYAFIGKKTILINCDLKKKDNYLEYLGVTCERGLTHYLTGFVSQRDIVQKTKIKNLDVVFPGPVSLNSSELLESELFVTFLNTLKAEYERVVIDVSTIGMSVDAQVVYPHVGFLLCVTRQGVTTKDMLTVFDSKYNSGDSRVGVVLIGEKLGVF